MLHTRYLKWYGKSRFYEISRQMNIQKFKNIFKKFKNIIVLLRYLL